MFYLIIKRFLDIIFGIIGLIFLVPITIIIKIVYVCTGDFHSVFLKQKRIGKNGKEFWFIKYRTMVIQAEKKLPALLDSNPELKKEYEEYKKLKNDPRITKPGKLIRKLSLDEMPQFLNVLIGNMSLIGNRPYLPQEKKDMGKYFSSIVSVKPGITGYWQVSGHNETTFKERLKLEEEYAKKASLSLDFKIFFKTFGVILRKKGI
ncbi:MAG: sugar transferase [Bacilli bacterium]|nr:sugar transferase [Bacilli bacterium]